MREAHISLNGIGGHLQHLPLPKPTQNGQVHMVIGTQVGPLMAAIEPDIQGEGNAPVARRTKLGYTIFGKTTPDNDI